MFDSGSRCVVVVGAQWGDEGKGKIVDALSADADMVVRYQGGANAGHTVFIDGDEFILHQIPSGILHPQTVCVVGNGVVIDPETFLEEIDQLEKRGVETAGRLHVSDRAHLVFPFHKMLEEVAEQQQRIGTTRRGIGPAYEDKIGRRGIRVADLNDRPGIELRLRSRIEHANQLLEASGVAARASVDEHLKLVDSLAGRIMPLATDTGLMIFESIKQGKRVLFEGAQGALLDVDHGTYPYVTSSNTTAGGAAVGAGIGPTLIDSVLGVTKAYTTRVGNGPLPTEDVDELGGRLRELGGEFGATTGRPRRCGWLDLVTLRYSALVNGISSFIMTKLDVLDHLAEIPVCVGYRYKGTPVEEMPAESEVLEQIEPVYDTRPGWQSATRGFTDYNQLPQRARDYLGFVADQVEVEIGMISTGPQREETLLPPNSRLADLLKG
ncbi:MAG: adenylosuccinate synthase [Acidobacteria bacterium]|nr:adenylosuccinate synthase [Acidobacteriota bacterium]